jgi:formate C-acetyltransferase
MAPDRPEWRDERQVAISYLNGHYPHVFTPGQAGHCQLDLSRLFALGIDGLIADLEMWRSKATPKQAEVYQSFIYSLDGFSCMIENAARTVEVACPQAGAARRQELEDMGAACRRIAHSPPGTFREALQLTWLAILGCQFADRAVLVSPGHLDRILWPFYQTDLAAGRLTQETALLLLEGCYLLINEYVPDGLAVSVWSVDEMLSARATIHSYLCLEALRRTKLVYPTVGVCWHEQTPPDLSDLALELMAQGYSNPAFFGDDTIQRGLQLYGVPVDEACDYVNSTCVEITPYGSSNVWVASPYFSLCKILVDEIAEQAETSTPAETFVAFLDGYRQRLRRWVAEAVEEENTKRRQRQLYGGKPLQSVFTRDCIERGLDIDNGGARYNWVECSFVGLANLADSSMCLMSVISAALLKFIIS